MTTTLSRLPLALLAAAALSGATPALAAGPTMVTVTGAIENTNRGAFDPAVDKLFEFNAVEFDEAMAFDLDGLKALPQTEARADFPQGGDVVTFSGPLLEDVLEAAGATGENVMIQAIDGYAAEAAVAEMVEMGAVLAIERDGAPLGIGDFGPAQIVFPRAERDDLGDLPDNWWVWQIYHIRVE